MAELVVILAAITSLSACGTAAPAAHPRSGSRRTSRRTTTMTAAERLLSRTTAQFRRRAMSMYASVLHSLATGPPDGNYYAGGVWHSTTTCWRCHSELATLAAILNRYKPSRTYRDWAETSFDVLLRDHQNANGSFGPPASGDQISTGATLVSMGTAYLELEPLLDHTVRARWATAIRRAAQWLSPRLTFYVNGNVNLQETLGMYIAWRVTSDKSFNEAYDRAWQFTLSPGAHWPGFGLHYVTYPRKPSGVDGSGYLAEKGAGAPGFDPHYTILQSDYAAELYVLSRQPRTLRLLNLLFNVLASKLIPGTLIIQTGSGSRETQPNVNGHFIACALPILALAGGRFDLLPLVLKQLGIASIDFHNYAVTGADQDQIIGNYAMALLTLKPSE